MGGQEGGGKRCLGGHYLHWNLSQILTHEANRTLHFTAIVNLGLNYGADV